MKKNNVWNQTALPALSLFASAGTLLCCALPALLVTLGLGAALAGLISAAPWLVVLTDHKAILFGGAGAMLACAVILQWRARNAPCPADPAQARICARLRKTGWILLAVSTLLYSTGFFFAFLAADLFYG